MNLEQFRNKVRIPSKNGPFKKQGPAKIIGFTAIGILSVCCVILLAKFGPPVITGLASLTDSDSGIVCSETNETSTTPSISQIMPDYTLFAQTYGDISQVKYFDIYNKSTAKCVVLNGEGSTFSTDICLVDNCLDSQCAQKTTQEVEFCSPQQTNCRLQEEFVTAKNTVAKWDYNCPLGCNDGACIQPADGNINSILLSPGTTAPIVTSESPHNNSTITPLSNGGINALLSDTSNRYLGIHLAPDSANSPADSKDHHYWTNWQGIAGSNIYGITFNLTNNGTKPLNLIFSVDDGSGGKIADVPVIQPGQTKTVLFPFVNLNDRNLLVNIGKKYGMNIATPAIQNYLIANLRGSNPNPLNLANIYGLDIYAAPSSANLNVRLINFDVSNIALYDSNVDYAARFYHAVDPFGQYSYATWTGKLVYDSSNANDLSSGISTLQSRLASEKNSLASRPGNWDQYGGFKQTLDLSEAEVYGIPGYFRTIKYMDAAGASKWWLLDPLDHLYYVTGIDNIVLSGASDQSTYTKQASNNYDRSQMFAWLPSNPLAGDDVLNYMYVKYDQNDLNNLSYNFYAANVARKYLSNTDLSAGSATNKISGHVYDSVDYAKEGVQQSWVDFTKKRLNSWGFNTQGQNNVLNSNPNVSGNVSYDIALHYSYNDSQGQHRFNSVNNVLPDPFDKNFKTSLTSDFSKQITPAIKKDKYLIGYIVDNELPWVGATLTPEKYYYMVISALGQSNTPIKQAFINQLKNNPNYKTVADLKAAWGPCFITSWNNFSWQQIINDSFTYDVNNPASTLGCSRIPDDSPMKKDLSNMLLAWTNQYYSTVNLILKGDGTNSNPGLDFNHLYLGSKFATMPPEAISACENYCDVVTFDYYRNNTPGFPKLDNVSQELATVIGAQGDIWDNIPHYDKPWLVGEYNYSAKDRGLYSTMPTWDEVLNSDARATNFTKYWGYLKQNPNIVGGQWHMYIDQPLTGDTYGENGQTGLVDVTDTPYSSLISAARLFNRNIYTSR